jgi:hypothetical protein
MHGPYVKVDGKSKKAYLIAIIDDHSRLIIHAEFYRQLCWDLEIEVKTGSRAGILKRFKATIREIAATKKAKDYHSGG